MVYANSTPVGFTEYVGSRAFRSWENAMAYANLPARPGAVYPHVTRRRVARGESGRWIVTPTFAAPRRAQASDNGHYPSGLAGRG